MDAYRSGFLASANGQKATDNPYASDAKRSQEWASGWAAHKEMRGESFGVELRNKHKDLNNAIWSEGRLAAANGKSAEDCPYELDSEKHWSWHLGWRNFKEYRHMTHGEAFVDPFRTLSQTKHLSDSAFEVISTSKHGYVKRLRSTLILALAIISFLYSLVFLLLDYLVLAGILGLLVAPTLLLYPIFRFLFGGKGGAVPMAAAFVAQNVLKYKVLKWLDNRERSR